MQRVFLGREKRQRPSRGRAMMSELVSGTRLRPVRLRQVVQADCARRNLQEPSLGLDAVGMPAQQQDEALRPPGGSWTGTGLGPCGEAFINAQGTSRRPARSRCCPAEAVRIERRGRGR